MSLAPSLVRRTNLGGTIHMLVGDSNPRYLAELNGSRVYCDDMASAEAFFARVLHQANLDSQRQAFLFNLISVIRGRISVFPSF